MRGVFHTSLRRSLLAAPLALILLSSPSAALQMMYTLRFTSVLDLPGVRIQAKLKLQRKTPPQPILATRQLVIRRLENDPPSLPLSRAFRETMVRAGGPVLLAAPSGSALKAPAYLQIFRPSTPQNPVFPPSDTDGSAS